MSARVDQGVVRSNRLSASWQRPGRKRVTRVWVGRASSTSRPVTYSAIRTVVVGLATATTPSWSRMRATLRYSGRVVRYSRDATGDTSVGTCVLTPAMFPLWRLFYSALPPDCTSHRVTPVTYFRLGNPAGMPG